jgi:peroxiredoxin
MTSTIAEQVHHLSETMATQPPNEVVGVFAREQGAWCPYCNIALSTYQAELVPELVVRGVGLIAVSPQTADASLGTQEKHELTFAVLSDPGNQVAKALGILTGPTEEARAAQLQLGLDLTAVNADGTTGLPMPTTVIVDADRVVRWIDVHPDYSTRSEPKQILAELDALAL